MLVFVNVYKDLEDSFLLFLMHRSSTYNILVPPGHAPYVTRELSSADFPSPYLRILDVIDALT